jgi:hypothetical protein
LKPDRLVLGSGNLPLRIFKKRYFRPDSRIGAQTVCRFCRKYLENRVLPARTGKWLPQKYSDETPGRFLKGIPGAAFFQDQAAIIGMPVGPLALARRSEGSCAPVQCADSEGWRSAFRTDVDHDSEVITTLTMIGQHGVEITREFGFADSNHPHVYDDTRCAGTLSSGQ